MSRSLLFQGALVPSGSQVAEASCEEEILGSREDLLPAPTHGTDAPGLHLLARSPLARAGPEQGRGKKFLGNIEVLLHVYNLGPVTGRLNELLMGANLGAFHCGIEVLGEEWSYQGFHDAFDDPTLSGVVRNEPREHPAYPYRTTVSLGKTPFDEEAIDDALDRMAEEWSASSYHLVRRNCITFVEEFSAALQTPERIPGWCQGAMSAGKSDALLPIADYGWSWFKWYCIRSTEQEQEAAKQAAEAKRNSHASSGSIPS
ncbi:unnamed protein product [Polarella glacialis]|uniref:PPPDE domain-containing protein n=1 Tax=Polarella glacialis TaxID=89957 RepID=A0A813GVA6_POLGL|nr:unnamed protein product [Polarella glacialis]